MKRHISLDYMNNRDLQEVFANKSPGDKCKLVVTMTLNKKDNSGVEGTIEEITPTEDYDKPDPKKNPTPREASTMSAPVAMDITMEDPMDSTPFDVRADRSLAYGG